MAHKFPTIVLSAAFLAVTAFFTALPSYSYADERPESASASKTEIITDEEAGVIRFMIDGKETMRLDESGLHVRENISYGGSITDDGPDGFDSPIAEESKENKGEVQ